MSNRTVIPVKVKGWAPSPAGCAIFIGNDDKSFVFYVDPSVGTAIGMFLNETPKERPLTHDLIGLILSAFDAHVERIIINDIKGGTYFCRLILSVENELKHRKIIELDARPSDCIALALQQKALIYVSSDVWEEVEDVSEILSKIQKEQESEKENDQTDQGSTEEE